MRAIDSALEQTLAVDEIIVVDDGSTDGSAEAVEEKFGSRVRVIRQQNAGVSTARNRGVRAARGEWIAFLDSDDLWHPQKTECQMEAISLLGPDVGLCFTDNRYGGHPGMTYSRFEETGFLNAPKLGMLHDPVRYIVGGREPFFTSSLLVRRSLLEEVGGFDEALSIREDTDLVFRLSFKTRFGFVGESYVEIDRTPSRDLGLCNLYGTRSDELSDCTERLYRKWLAMPEIVGGRFERQIRELLRLSHYDSAEAKIHEFRIKAALREIRCLKGMGEGYAAIALRFVVRKFQKWQRNRKAGRERVFGRRHRPGLDLA